MPVSGMDLPPELIIRVVNFLEGIKLTTYEPWNVYNEEPLRISKPEMGACALTCRYWAILIRPRMFNQVAVNSKTRAELFVAFLRSSMDPSFALGNCIKSLWLRPQLSDEPWIHLIFFAKSYLPKITTISVSMQGSMPAWNADTPSSPITMRSIHSLLPRAFPNSLSAFPSSGALRFSNVHFRNAGDVNAAVRSVRQLKRGVWPQPCLEPTSPHTIAFHNCHIGHATDGSAISPLLYRGVSLMLVVHDCPHPWTFLRPVVPTRKHRKGEAYGDDVWSPCIESDGLGLLEAVFQAIIEGCYGTEERAEMTYEQDSKTVRFRVSPGMSSIMNIFSAYSHAPQHRANFRHTIRYHAEVA